MQIMERCYTIMERSEGRQIMERWQAEEERCHLKRLVVKFTFFFLLRILAII